MPVHLDGVRDHDRILIDTQDALSDAALAAAGIAVEKERLGAQSETAQADPAARPATLPKLKRVLGTATALTVFRKLKQLGPSPSLHASWPYLHAHRHPPL